MITTTNRAMNLVSKAKTAEIMSRYRPIAPKPDLGPDPDDNNNGEPGNIKQSPYLQSVWANLQARPTRTRKRGRTSLAPTPVKRVRTAHYLPVYTNRPSGLVGLCKSPAVFPVSGLGRGEEEGIDLNRVPEERDFIGQLHGPVSPGVIAPQPIRPVGSSISVGCINEEHRGLDILARIPKKKHEVEDDVELEALPTVVSDTNNKVRLANSAYKEMVGQPECSWLDTMAHNHVNTCKVARICGEVVLHFPHNEAPPQEDLLSSDGFSCWATIEWGRPNEKNCSVHAYCDVIRLSCESKDYAFEWRFHTQEGKY